MSIVMVPFVTKLIVITSISPTVAEYSADVMTPSKLIFLVPVVSRNSSNRAAPSSLAVLTYSMKVLVSSALKQLYGATAADQTTDVCSIGSA
jgi:hypothetical protein